MYNRSTDYGDLINGIKTTTKDKKTQLAPSIIESKSQYLVEGLAPKMYIPLASAEIIHAGVPTGNVKAILDDDLGKLISNLKESQEYNFIFGYLFPMQKIVAMENVYLLERFIEIYNLVKQRNQVLKTIDDNFEKTSGEFWELQSKAQVFKDDILVYTTGANIGRTNIYQSAKKALCHCIVPAITLPAHTANHLMFCQHFLKILTAILTTPI